MYAFIVFSHLQRTYGRISGKFTTSSPNAVSTSVSTRPGVRKHELEMKRKRGFRLDISRQVQQSVVATTVQFLFQEEGVEVHGEGVVGVGLLRPYLR